MLAEAFVWKSRARWAILAEDLLRWQIMSDLKLSLFFTRRLTPFKGFNVTYLSLIEI